MAAWLTESLTKEGHQVALLSGEMTVEQRAAVIERFRSGKEKVLVTTNVCSRGKKAIKWEFKINSFWEGMSAWLPMIDTNGGKCAPINVELEVDTSILKWGRFGLLKCLLFNPSVGKLSKTFFFLFFISEPV